MQNIRAVSLLVAGSLISILIKPGEDYFVNQWSLIFLLFLLLVAIGITADKWIVEFYTQVVYLINKKYKRIGIFSPYEITAANSSWVNTSLEQLVAFLKINRLIHSSVVNLDRIVEFPVILNPYGGVYPERNVSTLESLNIIFDYVRKGGIYINIADIPFYYAFEEDLKRRVDTTPLVNDLLIIRSFLATQVAQRLRVFVLGINSVAYPGIFRVIQIGENTVNIYGSVIPVPYEGVSYNCSPIVAIPYGRGYFIFSTMEVNQGNLDSIIRLVYESLNLIER